jgi:hypothetical protein
MVVLEFEGYCPPCKATAVSAGARTGHEGFIQNLAFISLSMDGRQIGTVQLFLTNLIASTISYCFTHSITQIDHLDQQRSQELLAPLMTALYEREIEVRSIICDAASYELNALHFRDQASIQARNSQILLFSPLLFIQGLYHRFDTSKHPLIHFALSPAFAANRTGGQ